MHEMTINSKVLREALNAFQPFSAYERNKRLEYSYFTAPIWEDKVRIDVSAKDCKARLTYDAENYQLTTDILCISNDDVRFYLNITDLLFLLDNVEDEDILMKEFYINSSVCDIMADLRAMKATKGHNDFGYDFIINNSNKSLGRLQAHFAREPFSTPSSRFGGKKTGEIKDFSGSLLATTLIDFSGFTTNFSKIDQVKSFIWYSIEENDCCVEATTGHILKRKHYKTKSSLQFCGFGVIGEIAELIATLITDKLIVITFGFHYCALTVDGISIEMAYNYVERRLPFNKVLDNFLPIELLADPAERANLPRAS